MGEAKKAVILGAGATGLKTGAELAKAGYAVTILEKNSKVGGMAHSFRYKDYILDYGPHKFYSQIKGIMPEYKELLGQDCLTREKTNSIYLLGTYFRFPPDPVQLLFGISPIILTRCGISYTAALIKNATNTKENISYEEYFTNGFGKAGYELLFKDLCWKVWGDPKEIAEELARRRVPIPNVKELLKNVVTGAKERPDVSAKYFYYPRQGFGQLAEILHKKIQEQNGTVLFNSIPTQIETKDNKITIITYKDNNGKEKQIKDVNVLISTIYLNDFIELFIPKARRDIQEAANALQYRSLILCYIFLNKDKALKDCWYFYPEKNVCFNRVSEQKSFSPFTVPAGKTVITAEITCDPDSELYNANEEAIKEKIIADLEKVDVLKKEEVADFLTKKSPRVYPAYTIGFRNNIRKVLYFIHNIKNVYSIGRQGLFNYNNTDHCMDMANNTAQHILRNGSRREWEEIVRSFDEYKIVD